MSISSTNVISIIVFVCVTHMAKNEHLHALHAVQILFIYLYACIYNVCIVYRLNSINLSCDTNKVIKMEIKTNTDISF